MQSFSYKLEKPPKYEYTDTGSGTWKTYQFENGVKFREYKSHFHVGDQPFVTITSGIDPETGKMPVAKGFIAIGQQARGFIAVGQMVSGYFAVGQMATARIAGIGQFIAAPLALGQFSIALATISQFGIAGTGIFQAGITFFGGLGQAVIDLARIIF